ncbi:MAG: hypothetical protein HY289_08835 [Planctomycetes bacterium]|nr:hypothetical protein [Planctomycetota bacterium]
MYLNVFLNWVVPFFALMMRSSKRSAKVLINVSIAVLVGRWLDLYLMILPADSTFLSIVTALAMTVGAIGMYVLGFGFGFAQAAAVPVHDPYLVESLPGSIPKKG